MILSYLSYVTILTKRKESRTMLLKAKKYAAIGMVMAVLLSIVSACTPASVDITPGSTPDTQAMTTPEITAEPTEEPTAKPTPKPTMTPAPTPIGEPKRLVYAEGDEMPEYDDSVYDEYDIVTIYYPDGNSREEDPRPFGVSMLLPKGWTWRDGIFDGLGYFPSEELAGYCIAEWRCGFHTKSIYNEKENVLQRSAIPNGIGATRHWKALPRRSISSLRGKRLKHGVTKRKPVLACITRSVGLHLVIRWLRCVLEIDTTTMLRAAQTAKQL